MFVIVWGQHSATEAIVTHDALTVSDRLSVGKFNSDVSEKKIIIFGRSFGYHSQADVSGIK